MTLRTAACLCGSVKLGVTTPDPHLHACHCENCRRQSGSCGMTVMVPHDGLRVVEGTDAIRTYVSSAWAARSFCGQCGSGLWYRMTGLGDRADYYMAAGILDDLTGLSLKQEIYYDSKPAAWAFADETEKLTGAEVEALYAASPEE